MSDSNGQSLRRGHPNAAWNFSDAEAALFQYDRADDDGLDVYTKIPGSSGDVRGGPQLQATLACKLDNLNLALPITGDGMTSDHHGTARFGIAVAIFFKTEERLEDLTLVSDMKLESFFRVLVDSAIFRTKLSTPEKNRHFDGPFPWVARNSWLEVLQWYATRPGALGKHTLTQMGRTPITWAAANGADDVLEWYLADDAIGTSSLTLKEKDNKERTPLSLAALYDRISTIELLLGHDRSLLDGVDGEGCTPLSLAAEKGNYGAVEALLAALAHRGGKEQRIQYLEEMDEGDWTALSRAARTERSVDVLKVLVQESMSNREPMDAGLWVTSRVFEAAEKGWAMLMKVLLENSVQPIPDAVTAVTPISGDSMPPLCIAARNGHAQVVDLLLDFNANPNFVTARFQNTALMLAILGDAEEASKEAVVERLLRRGGTLNITRPNTSNQTALSLAVDKNLPAIRILLSQWDEDGPLAGNPAQLDPSGVDLEATATATKFFVEAGVMRSQPSRIAVADLLKEPGMTKDEHVSFRWFHLPANNMRWIEVLMTQLYGTTSAYKILKSERWVRRQHQSMSVHHHGGAAPAEIHHARFMRPLCQSFDASPSCKLYPQYCTKVEGICLLQPTQRVQHTNPPPVLDLEIPDRAMT